MGCSKCGHVILADTEDWKEPLCLTHYSELGSPDVPQLMKERDTLLTELRAARVALDKSCICGEFGYIGDEKCPACKALTRIDKVLKE